MSQQVPQYPSSAPWPGQPPVDHGFGPPPGGYPPPAPAGTDPVAVLALVFAFVFSPVGLVLGIVGRRRTARSGRPGRGLATAGLVLSVVFLVVGIAAAVYATMLVGNALRALPTTTTDLPGISAPADPVPPPSSGLTGPAGSGTVEVAEGEYGPELPADLVAATITEQAGVADVVCPGYLPALLDASSACAGTVDGQPVQVRATVTAVDGDEAAVDLTWDG